MIGIVIVSHSSNLAKSVIELASMMAPDAKMAPAGGLENGALGTSFEKIQHAIESVYSDDGVLVLVDMGSAVMTTQMVLEMMPDKKVEMADCPLVEGAVLAAMDAVGNMPMEEIQKDLTSVRTAKKF
ncbi:MULTISPECIES: dihydroxyacetone kinase phosphoryl donor subunit DhaM [Caproicibacterium]|uniref:phosphoenolpyruvate--glycerone phosphotransferase n=1 Tax=Caproicibacterium lactatifermentans TaxID=2666138 RepID=A0A859DS34_9FIRM|nr:dihydroxyacetone kinase phosphoryl donor subunit DhaM [Caproicibacterium lactatifermentans]ARP49787.1 dihydroxyacetone kinase [Ruminococcaceae bacterium CPB6]MDD4808359.1 dihydroxyacetone kinase phosphoryl donor subunit DhaM [Oscillospiraceae bacterium]QKN24484.1 PTS-dependent dihydroxyacetone kinase phosphotransferase subunit DhaM [Caproicibacterium lactatifermentans]